MALEVIQIQVGGQTYRDFDQAFRSIGDRLSEAVDTMTPLLEKDTRDYLLRVHQKLATAHGHPWNGTVGSSSPTLFSRTGQGLKDILDSVRVGQSGDDIAGQMALRGYMAVQETGATIRAKGGRYLTIPLPAAMDSRGVPLKASARDWPNTFVARSKKGNLLIFQKQGRRVVPLYLLKTSVQLPPRLQAEKNMVDELGWFERQTFETISKQLDRYV